MELLILIVFPPFLQMVLFYDIKRIFCISSNLCGIAMLNNIINNPIKSEDII